MIAQREYWQAKRKRRAPDHKVVKSFVKPKIEFIEKRIGDISRLKLLDVGCGNGFFSYYFQDKLCSVGVDYSEFMLSVNPCQTKVLGSVLALPFKDNTFDIVFCSNLLHHLDDPLAAVKEMSRLSRMFIIVSEPNRNNPLMFLFCLLKPEERSGLRFSLRYLKKIISRAKLTYFSGTTLGSILPNVTPVALLPFLQLVNKENLFGFYNLIIAKRK